MLKNKEKEIGIDSDNGNLLGQLSTSSLNISQAGKAEDKLPAIIPRVKPVPHPPKIEEEKNEEIVDDFFNEFPDIEPENPKEKAIWLPEEEIY